MGTFRTILFIIGMIRWFRKNNPEFRRGTDQLKRQLLKFIESITDQNVIQGSTVPSSSRSTSSSFIASTKSSMKNFLGLLFKGVLGIIVLMIIFSGFKVVSPGDRGVKITLGSVSPQELTEGLHFKIPLIQTIKPISIQVQKIERIATSASKDLQTVQTDVALNYNLKPGNVVSLYQNIGDEAVIAAKIIEPAIQESVKAATALFTAEQLISKRSEVNVAITEGLERKLDALGINVVVVNIVNFQFSQAFDTAIEEKVKAEQEAFTEQNRLEKVKFQAQQKVEQARGEAESTLLKAKAEAEANTILSESLTEQLVKYKGLEKWNGTLPTVTSDAGVILQGEF